MNSLTGSFTGYQDIPKSSLIKNEPDLSITSPHSDSTTQYAHSVSPNLHDFTSIAHDHSSESWNYDSNFHLQDGYYGTDIKVEADEKLSAKSKRIMKRNVAKERTKVRKDAESFLAGVDSKYLPEGYDDPNLDEKTKKKMVQMVRNRISAQNSRDRKKVVMQQLEEINAQLVEEVSTLKMEKASLMNEISRLQQSEAQLMMENQSLKMNNETNNSNLCSSCRRNLNGDDMLQVDEQPEDDINHEQGFSNLSSPILSRFPSSGRGLFTFFTFAALVCIILVVNVNPGGEIVLSGGNKRVMDTRLLEVKNEVCRDSVNIIQGKGELPFKNSLVIQNMQPLKRHFDINHALTFKSHIEKTALFQTSPATAPTQTSNVIMKYEPEFQNAIVDYDYFKAPNLRKKNPPIIARSLPQLGSSTGEPAKTSTLFCPNGFEFIEPKNQNMDIEQVNLEDRILDLEKADYLQLFVPRQGLVRYNIHSNVSDLYDLPIRSEENENSMLEIWCKVFLIRDLSSSL